MYSKYHKMDVYIDILCIKKKSMCIFIYNYIYMSISVCLVKLMPSHHFLPRIVDIPHTLPRPLQDSSRLFSKRREVIIKNHGNIMGELATINQWDWRL